MKFGLFKTFRYTPTFNHCKVQGALFARKNDCIIATFTLQKITYLKHFFCNSPNLFSILKKGYLSMLLSY